MPTIRIGQFRGIVPRLEARLLPEAQAQTAENCDLLSGVIQAVRTGNNTKTLPDSDRISVYPYNSDWLSWITDVDVVKGPLTDDQYDRIYYTGDGAPKVRGILSDTEVEYDLGVPKPLNEPTVTVQAKAATTWTRTWYYQYEEPDGTVSQSGDLTDPTEVTPGSSYTIATVPTKVAASAQAIFVAYFRADDANGTLLGWLYPDISFYTKNSDFYLDGAQASSQQVNADTSPEATITISYDTTRASDYEVNRAYAYTFVSAFGEEGPPSDPSDLAVIDPTEDGALSNMDTTVAGNYNITLKRIYRTVTTVAGTFYQFVAEIAIGTATYTDSLADGDLGEVLPSTYWIPPDSGLSGLVSLPQGFFAAFKGKTVYFSEPYQPHAWPISYAINVDYDIVGLGVNATGLVVTTVGYPSIMTGNEPGAISVTGIDSRQACASKRSIAIAGESGQAAVVYASPDGLVVVSGGSAQLFTEGLYTRAQWQALDPDTMIGEVHDGKYFGFSDQISLVIDLDEPNLMTTTDQTAAALFSDLETDTLYYVDGDTLYAWRGHATTNRLLTWKSKQYAFPRRMSFSVARVRAQAYPVTLNLYGDGALRQTCSVPGDVAFRLPTIRDETLWEIEVLAAVDIYSVMLSTNMRDL